MPVVTRRQSTLRYLGEMMPSIQKVTTRQKWRKVLYENQNVPDNYTDESFLDEMKKNVNIRKYELKLIIYEAGIVSQQLSTISIFVSTFYYIDQNAIHPTTILFCMLIVLLFGIMFRKLTRNVNPEIGSLIAVPLFVFAISPVLKTLTKTISTDTIYAMSTGMLMANLLFHDYGAGVAIVSKAISLNTGIFAAICLGSRLHSSWHVYVFVMLAILLFAVFPEFRKDVKAWHRKAYIFLTELLVIVAVLLLIRYSIIGACALVCSHFSITFFFPLWMERLQQLKNNIHGPWDEAMIKQ